MSRSRVSPIDVYKLLPRTNCKECGEENCMAFATKLVNREVTLDKCTPLLAENNKGAYLKLREMLKPPIREIIIGAGDRAVKIGGKLVMYRHELTYVNPTPIAIDVTDEMSEDEFMKRVRNVEAFTFSYIGSNLTLDMIALRSTSNNAEKFGSAVKRFADLSSLPAILCSFNPEVIENGLSILSRSRPLIYAANKDNWKAMADLALKYNCPLTIFSPNDLNTLKSLARTLLEYGVKDLVIDPGTFPDEGFADTVNNLTMIRRAAIRDGDDMLGFPMMGVSLTAWIDAGDSLEVAAWDETTLASMLINRYVDILIMHSLEGWSLLPVTILRNNLYTDPRKPVAVEAGLKTFGQPIESSPLLLTTNFALTYYTVASDIESGKVNCYLLVIDSEGLSVESSVAGRKLTAEKVAEALKKIDVESIVNHKTVVIPGRAARLSGEIEETSGWRVIVGPIDSSEIPRFVKDVWPTKIKS